MSILLKATTETIDAILAAAANANQQHVFICYEDVNKCNGRSKFGSATVLTTDDTEVIVCPAPGADDWRIIKHISVFNDDDATSTITLRIDNGTTEPVLFKAALATKESIYWTPESGWTCFTAAGKLKTIAH